MTAMGRTSRFDSNPANDRSHRKITKREAIITQFVNRSASRFSRDQDPPRHGAGY